MADLKTELEDLTGTLIRGDVCPVVVKLLRETRFPNELLRYLGEEVAKKEEQEIVNVQPAPSFMDLFKDSTIVNRR